MESTSNTPMFIIKDDDDGQGQDLDRCHVDQSPPAYLLHPTPLTGVCVSIFSSLLWGLYPVLCRYIMLHEPGKPHSTALLAVLMSFNSVLAGGYYLLRPSSSSSSKSSGSNSSNKGGNEASKNKLTVACLYGLLCLARMQTNMASTRMTRAYNTQMTAMSLPFFTAFLARIFLHEKIHSALLPALSLMLLGGFLVFYGQGAFAQRSSEVEDNSFKLEDLLGVLLQLVSVVFSAGVKIAFKSTEGILDKTELLLSQFIMSALPLLPYAMIFEFESVHALLFELNTNGIICMVGLAFGIYIVGNVTQIYATRSIGASNHAASNSMRLVSAVFGSTIILNEPLNKPVEWIGMLLIVISILGYWYIRNCKEINVANGDTDTDSMDNNKVISTDQEKGLMTTDDNGIEMSISINDSRGGNGGGAVYNPLAGRSDDDIGVGVRINDFEDTSIDISRHEVKEQD